MHQCPHCQSAKQRQVKSGFNRTGSQRFQCQSCRRQYTPEPNPLGYDDQTRQQALKLYLDGFRRVGRLLSVNHQTVANWVTAAHALNQSLQQNRLDGKDAAGHAEFVESLFGVTA